MVTSEIQRKLSFAIVGSFKDAVGQEVPLFHRNSPIQLEKVVNGSFQLENVSAFLPSFYSDDGSFLLEPSRSE